MSERSARALSGPAPGTGLLGRRASPALFLPVLAILLGYVVWPALRVVVEGGRPEVLGHLFESADSANARALYNSVWISLWSVVGAGILGTGLAWSFHRFDFPVKRVLVSVAALPLALPPLVGVLAFLFLYGESGILPRGIQAIFSMESVPFSFTGLWAVWLVHVYSLYVFFYLFCRASLAGIDRSQIEASQDLGASGVRTFLNVTLPHMRPAIVSAALLVFMISMASFTAPLLFAGTENFLTLQIYNYKMNGNLEYSAGVSVVLTAICLLFLLFLEAGRSRRSSTPASKGASPIAMPLRSGAARAIAVSFALLVLTFLLLPILTIVLISFVREGSWTWQVLPTAYTLDNYAGLLSEPDVFRPVANSLRMASLATAANLIFGVAAALLIVKGRMRGRALIRTLSVLPFAIPGTVIAVNLIVTFNEPTVLAGGNILVGTVWLLPLAYFIRHIPLIVRSTIASLESYDDRLTDASQDLGAGTATTVRRVVLPIISPGILAGTLLTFVTALGEFVSSILLYVFDNRPISVEILSQLRLYDFGAAAAYSVFLMILIGASTFIVHRVGAGAGRGVGGPSF
ncbi:MAG: iron ABC transporter permease [Rhodothermales bacterium]|nr:iron ABC transporter permease [Rhodothermales bacterium]